MESIDGYIVAGTASDGEQALNMLPGQDVDVVVLGLEIPGINGEETLKQIKADSPFIKALILTSFSDACVIDSIKKLGADGY